MRAASIARCLPVWTGIVALLVCVSSANAARVGKPGSKDRIAACKNERTACKAEKYKSFHCGRYSAKPGMDASYEILSQRCREAVNDACEDAKCETDKASVTPDFGPGGSSPGTVEAQPRLRAEIRTGAGLCLDAYAPEMGNNGGRVQVWACNGSNRQSWTYDSAAKSLRVGGGLCLDVHAGINQNGNRVQIWACNGQWQQQWTPLADGSLRNAGGLCLDVHGADQTTNGARVQIWQCNGSQQQRFTSSAF